MSPLSRLLVPVLPMREEIVFPQTTKSFFVGRPGSMEALDKALSSDKLIFVVAQKNTGIENPAASDLFSVGVLVKVLQIMRLPNGSVKALFEATQRARLISAEMRQDLLIAEIELIQDSDLETREIFELAEKAKAAFYQHAQHNDLKIKDDVYKQIKLASPLILPDIIAPHMAVSRTHKQSILEPTLLEERLELIIQFMSEEQEIKKLEEQLRKKVQENIHSTHKEGYLQDQLRSIQKELGQTEDSRSDSDDFLKKIKEAGMPKEVEDVAIKEFKKIKMMSPMSSESNVVRNYLEWLIAMPWKTETEDNFDLEKAQTILDEDHYGLEKVKERIVEYLAVAQLKGTLKGPIICLVGPPGVGKTSLAKSIARSLNRNFVRMSLGGVRDEAEIRGHRRTYIGALPGKIIQSIRKAKSRNPVLLMDEVDKLYQSVVTDPSAALLEVLDPEQNNTFMDHYLEVEYDLSHVLFLCTANSIQNIAAPLLDRMEVIHLSGYTELEKYHIAKNFLVQRQCKAHGMEPEKMVFQKEGLFKIIREYTREAGVRNLEREIGKVCRKTVTQLVRQNEDKKTIVTPKLVEKLLGTAHFNRDKKGEANEIGVAMGLGVTTLGGELMMVEAGLMPGSGKVSLTGKLGEVMQESAQAAYSYVRANALILGIDADIFEKLDLHIHLPEGATPKDGPSAGLPLMMSIISVCTKIPIQHDVAMTGEITLRGHVTEIGGLKEKLLAAKRGGLRMVLIPKDNAKDLEDVPHEVLEGLTIQQVDRVDQALPYVLEHLPPTSFSVSGLERSLNSESLQAISS
ncbi:MAG: endopeptidase La [SAR324 cluster bacterium]|nr:endopeptidase La [SAR324 cluster bacterium]